VPVHKRDDFIVKQFLPTVLFITVKYKLSPSRSLQLTSHNGSSGVACISLLPLQILEVYNSRARRGAETYCNPYPSSTRIIAVSSYVAVGWLSCWGPLGCLYQGTMSLIHTRRPDPASSPYVLHHVEIVFRVGGVDHDLVSSKRRQNTYETFSRAG
jgi:hypothetical protein